MCRYIESTDLKVLDAKPDFNKTGYEKMTCEESKDTFVHFRSQALLWNTLEMYDSYRIQGKAGRAQGNNTGQRRTGIYFSLKIH